VRGELVLRAMAHAKALERREARPFDKLVYCNIGNPQELRQAPITFFRQVLALTCYPPLIDAAASLRGPGGAPLFAPDAVERARRYMATIPGGTGAWRPVATAGGWPLCRAAALAL
jgi:alanine transaminase